MTLHKCIFLSNNRKFAQKWNHADIKIFIQIQVAKFGAFDSDSVAVGDKWHSQFPSAIFIACQLDLQNVFNFHTIYSDWAYYGELQKGGLAPVRQCNLSFQFESRAVGTEFGCFQYQ